MSKVKSFFRNFFQVAPFVLSNTVIFIPYLLFLDVGNNPTLESILPFVLFYTFRMTGIFLLKSFRLNVSSFNILILSVLLGGLGSLIGIFGEFFHYCYFLSAILLGISGAWLPVANTTVNFHEKEQGFTNMTAKKYPFAFVLFVILMMLLNSSIALRNALLLMGYTMLFIASYHTITHYPNYEIDFNKVDRYSISFKELFLFVTFFVLLFVLRVARLLFEPEYLNFVVIVFFGVFIVLTWSLNKHKKELKLPLWLNLLTFVNGMCSNFILLFGTFYVAIRMGADKIPLALYLPYICGIIIAMFGGKILLRSVKKIDPKVFHMGGLMLGLFLLLFIKFFPIGVFVLSFFISLTGTFLNQVYYETERLPKDQRLIDKYMTQAKGSLAQQFLMMSLLWLLTKQAEIPVVVVLQITAYNVQRPEAIAIVEKIHVISIVFLMLFFFVVLYASLKVNHERKKNEL
ncbi:hypothetical protein [Enterococcus rivorum]|nr:hypothetical protein [Enterococcus rivorum]MBP2100612.1 hypothetical protein [Enterococcus rivorum]